MTGIRRARKRSESRAEFASLNRRAMLGAFFAAALTRVLPAVAATAPAAATLTPQDNADLQRIAAYLSSVRTMYAKFQQVSGSGGRATGQLWMARPGRMRFEYDPPSPILLLADRFYVYFVDKQLAQMSKVGLKSTPAWFLLRDPITFDDLVIKRFERGANTLTITIVDPKEPDNGSLTIAFSNQPLALVQWTIVDQQHKTTTVSISNAQFGVALDPELFVYRDPFAAGRRSYQP